MIKLLIQNQIKADIYQKALNSQGKIIPIELKGKVLINIWNTVVTIELLYFLLKLKKYLK